jgi:alkanesulfonate monooxygenase SsuD/methylene tetrahydromethanopterin reductase-like flavin-dependent oxidoreductase (luciferase family)
MLPNHAPLIVAEQIWNTGDTFPNRIDLGLGRAQEQINLRQQP